MKSFICIFFPICLILSACGDNKWQTQVKDKLLQAGVEKAFLLAGSNRGQLEQVLTHYARDMNDSLKLQAACLLIDAMQWHETKIKALDNASILWNFIQEADQIYYGLIKDKTMAYIQSQSLKDTLNKMGENLQTRIKQFQFSQASVADTLICHLQIIKASFLIEQIDYAFTIRSNLPMIQKLSFIDFCDYILPYQTCPGHYFTRTNKDYNNFFSKYTGSATATNMPLCVERYDSTIAHLRLLLGAYPLQTGVGFEELFFDKVPKYDCFDRCSYGAAALNACGVPVKTDYNIAHRHLQGKHSDLDLLDTTYKWNLFNPEFNTPGTRDEPYEKYIGWMNRYVYHFFVQKNTPYFLKAYNEMIPEELSSPFIEDATSKRMYTLPIVVPFTAPTSNHLAYLATFSSEHGITPVTWGIINKAAKQVKFKVAIPDRLYFLVYCVNGELITVGQPFLLTRDSTKICQYRLNYYPDNDNGLVKKSAVVASKFPHKTKMIKLASQLIGMTVLGANTSDFSLPDTLFVLKDTLSPCLQDILLNNNKAYHYYRLQAPPGCKMYISELQYLTSPQHQYTNTTVITPLPIISPKQKKEPVERWARLLSSPMDSLKTFLEYDGNMQTAPINDSQTTMSLEQPQVVSAIRLAPLNADNGIQIGDRYSLYGWGHGSWELVETQKAEYNYLLFKELSVGKLYWLKNLDRGKEESPFVVNTDGLHRFIYGEKE